jgi:hypothetical protein
VAVKTPPGVGGVFAFSGLFSKCPAGTRLGENADATERIETEEVGIARNDEFCLAVDCEVEDEVVFAVAALVQVGGGGDQFATSLQLLDKAHPEIQVNIPVEFLSQQNGSQFAEEEVRDEDATMSEGILECDR